MPYPLGKRGESNYLTLRDFATPRFDQATFLNYSIQVGSTFCGAHRRSRVRARVEHVFAFQESAMGGKLVRTIGIIRARAKIGLKNLAYNFQRFMVLTRPRQAQAA